MVTFEGHTNNITSVSFHSQGKWLVTGSEDKTIKIWDLRCVGAAATIFGAPDVLTASRTGHLHRNYNNEAPGLYVSTMLSFQASHTDFIVNDVCVHPNQGELISCDQAGRIKQWDLSENICTHELVRVLYKTLISKCDRIVMSHGCVLPDSCWRRPNSFSHASQ